LLHPQVSTIYNKALATSNTGIIVNSVVILFIMDIDEKIFATLAAINEKWTAHAAESDDLATAESMSKNNADDRDNMNNELAAQREQIAAQRDEIAIQKEQMATQREEMAIQREQMETQRNEMAMLRAAVKKITQEANGSRHRYSSNCERFSPRDGHHRGGRGRCGSNRGRQRGGRGRN